MIIFHQHHVVQPEAMIHAAAGDDRRLFQSAQSRRGFARIKNLYAIAFRRIDKLFRERGDAGEALQKI